MFRKIFCFFFIVFVSNSTLAQQLIPLNEEEYLHSINNCIRTTTNDSLRLSKYLQLSEYWAPKDSLKSIDALNKVLHATKKNLLQEGVLDYYQAVFYAHQNQKELAIKHYDTAINLLAAPIQKNPLLIKAYYNAAYIQVENKGYDFMVNTLTNYCIPLSKDLNNTELLGYSYTQLGLTFMSVGQFDKAQEYHNEALAELEKLPETTTVHLLTYLNLVSNYCYKPDSKTAKIYLDKAQQLLKNYPNSQHYPNYYYQEAMYYTTTQSYDKALKSLDTGAVIAKQKNQAKLLSMLYFRMYNVYLMQKDYIKAKRQLELILKENIINKEAFNRKITYTQLAAVNNVLGDNKEAYQWMKKSAALGDSLQQSKLLEKMNELDVLHQTTEKQKTIDNLELENKENELLNQSKNMRIKLLAMALLLSLVIITLVYRTSRKQKQLNQQIKVNHNQELAFIDNQRKYEATQAILKGEEQERQRIAQDLHDSMGGMLASIRMTLSSNKTLDKDDILSKLDKSINEMRRISRNLMPETLKELGLKVAVKELCVAMSQPELYIQFETFNLSDDIPFKTQLALYRIIQEGLSNSIKYAQANTVIVQISQDKNTINLTIEDDGIGFDPSKVNYGLGIKNIKNRSELINGTIAIISGQGEGTTINLECNV